MRAISEDGSVRCGQGFRHKLVGDGETVYEAPRTRRWGPDPAMQAANEMREDQERVALDRLIRETYDRLRRPLQFWEDPL